MPEPLFRAHSINAKAPMAAGVVLALLPLAHAARADDQSAADAVPPAAAQVGFDIHTFAGRFNAKTVDTGATQKRGFQWYCWNLFGYHSDPKSVVLNADGSATFMGQSWGGAGELVSAVQDSSGNGFVGHSFGGGAYIEAVLKWPPLPDAAGNVTAWPAFWALALEGHVKPYESPWAGQRKAYLHMIETDFFEALPDLAGRDLYGGSLHDWYGILGKTCAPDQMCQARKPSWTGRRAVPEGTDFSQYHRYGFLWVPATQHSKGYAQFFFDSKQVGYTYEWELLRDQPPPPTNQPWAFGILDQQHLFIILGTGSLQPMTVQSVDVWQGGTAANLDTN